MVSGVTGAADIGRIAGDIVAAGSTPGDQVVVFRTGALDAALGHIVSDRIARAGRTAVGIGEMNALVGIHRIVSDQETGAASANEGVGIAGGCEHIVGHGAVRRAVRHHDSTRPGPVVVEPVAGNRIAGASAVVLDGVTVNGAAQTLVNSKEVIVRSDGDVGCTAEYINTI